MVNVYFHIDHLYYLLLTLFLNCFSGLNLDVFVVSTKLYATALASASFGFAENNQFSNLL